MKVLAIDPGIEKIGYSFFNKTGPSSTSFEYLSSGLITTSKKDAHHERLKQIYDHLKLLIDLHKPEMVVLEQLFFFKNAKTVISVAQAQGVIELITAQHKLPIKYLTPLQIKEIITGYGNADKKSVQKMLELTLKEKVKYIDDDQSDAVACGLAFCYLNAALM